MSIAFSRIHGFETPNANAGDPQRFGVPRTARGAQADPRRAWTSLARRAAVALGGGTRQAPRSSAKPADAPIRDALAAGPWEDARFRDVVEALPTAVLLCCGGRVAYCNPAGACLLGVASPRSVVGRPPEDLFAAPDRADVRTALRHAGAGGSPPDGTAALLLRRDGSTLPVSVSAKTLAIGPARAVLLSLHDRSEQVRLDELFRQSQKMEAMGLLAGGVVHDFNNLLTVITGYSGLLLDRVQGERERPMVQAIAAAATHATSLIGQLMAFSRRRAVEPRIVDVNESVRDAGQMLRRLLGEHIELRTSIDDRPLHVRMDPGSLTQALLNLGINGRDAMAHGGRLTIETRRVEAAGATPGHAVMLAVHDTGCGMSPEIQARIFEPFFTTKAPGQGTGLGLAALQGIVRQHHGRITMESIEGAGTSFRLYFPAVEPAETGPAGADPGAPATGA